MGTYGPKPTSAPAGAIILHAGDNVSAIVNAAPTGATFYFEPGVYRGVSITPKDGQTFIGAEGAVLNGSAVLTNWTQSGNLWVIGGQTQQGKVNTAAEYVSGSGHPETVFLDNTPLKPVDSFSKMVPGTFFFDYAANKIYIADNPAGHTIEAGKQAYAFSGNAQNVTVQNLVIEKYDPPVQDGAIQGNKGWTIQDNEVRLNYAVGILAIDSSKVIGNYAHDNGEMGLGGYGHNILVQGNELAKNGYWSGVDVNWEGGGFKFANTDNLVVRGNYSHDNNGSGMWTDIDNIHTLYEDNLVAHNTGAGISHEISYDAIIRNNTLIGNGAGDPRSWWWGNEIQIQNSSNVDVYGNRIDMTGGGNGIVLIQQNRGSGEFGSHATTGNHIHDNIIVDHDRQGFIGGVADYNQSGMLNGGNTWSNNQYYMSDAGDRFQWGGADNFAKFKAAADETGSISQSSPDTSSWGTIPGTDPTHSDPGTGAGTGNTDTGAGADDGNSTGAGTGSGTGSSTGGTGTGTGAGDGNGTGTGTGSGTGSSAGGTGTGTGAGDGNGTGTDTGTGDTSPPPPADLVLRGDRGSDHLTGSDGNDKLYGAKGNDVLMGNSGNDLLSGGDGRDILVGGHGNDNIKGGSGKDYMLLDGVMQDYTFAVTKQGVTVTDSTGEVDTVKNVEVFHFSDGTNYVVGRHGLAQTGDQTINSFLAASGVDQSLLGTVSTAQAQQAAAQSANPTGSTASVNGANVGNADPHPSTTGTSPGTLPPITQQHGALFGGIATDAALWNAVDAASNNPTHADNVLANLKQQVHDAFDQNGANLTTDDLAALLHLMHHE